MTICVIRSSWIIPNSTNFLVNCLTNLFFSGIPLLYYYINLISSIIFHLFSGDVYLSSAIFNSFSSVFKTFCEDFFETLVILSAILLPIKSIIASSAVFLNCSLWSCFYCIWRIFFSTIKKFLTMLLRFLKIFLAKDKSP